MPAGRQRADETVAIDVLVEAGDWPAKAGLRALAGKAIRAAVDGVDPPLAPGAEVSIVFTNDAAIRKLNRQYRQKDKATNVLSFPAAGHQTGRFGPLLGDIVLAAETVSVEAGRGRLKLEHHLTHLILHGFLHLLGYDHENDGEAAVMEGLETSILAALGIADPYASGDRSAKRRVADDGRR